MDKVTLSTHSKYCIKMSQFNKIEIMSKSAIYIKCMSFENVISAVTINIRNKSEYFAQTCI